MTYTPSLTDAREALAAWVLIRRFSQEDRAVSAREARAAADSFFAAHDAQVREAAMVSALQSAAEDYRSQTMNPHDPVAQWLYSRAAAIRANTEPEGEKP